MADNLLLRIEPNIAKILVSKDKRAPFRSKQRKFIQSCLVQLRKLNSSDFCPDMRRKIDCFGVLAEKVG